MYSENMERLATAMLAFAIMAAAVSTARADPPTTCNTTKTGGMIDGNVVISGTCTLIDVTVGGNVLVGTGAALTVEGGKVAGNIQANGCNFVRLQPDASDTAPSVGGNVQISMCTGVNSFNGYHSFGVTDIAGNFQCHNNAQACLALNGKVGGNLQVYDNSPSDGTEIGSNTVGGSLQVYGNTNGVGGLSVSSNRVEGNLAFNDNTECFCEIDSNTVGGNVQVNRNSVNGIIPELDVSANIIGGNLSCQSNTGLTGSGNTVHGKELDQCVGF
jgi:hypothetical protein